jgi:hypothetical protein
MEKEKMRKLINNYWFVFYAGIYMILAVFYLCEGEVRDVFWNSYIKTLRYFYLPIVPIYVLTKKYLTNCISILFGYGLMSLLTGLIVFRLFSAVISKGNYELYFNYMQSDIYGLMISSIIFCILVAIKLLNLKK